MVKPLGTREHYREYCENCLNAGLTPNTWESFRRSFEPTAPLNDDTVTESEVKSLFTTPALEAASDLILTLTIVAVNTEEWKRFQYSGESKDVIIDRVDYQIVHHLCTAQAEIERLQTENARLRNALEPFARIYQAWEKAVVDAPLFLMWTVNYLKREGLATTGFVRMWFEQAARLLENK